MRICRAAILGLVFAALLLPETGIARSTQVKEHLAAATHAPTLDQANKKRHATGQPRQASAKRAVAKPAAARPPRQAAKSVPTGTARSKKATEHHAAKAHAPALDRANKKRHARTAQTRHAAGKHASAKHAAARPHRQAVRHAPTPSSVADRPLIVIDPGHGGRDPGAIGAAGTLEKTVTLAAAQELRHALQATGRYRIALTRTADKTISLADRLAFARRHDADLLIAIHADASTNRHARGASVYVSSGDTTTRLPANRGNSVRIARALSAPEPQPEPGSAWLQNSIIEQLSNDVRMVPAPARKARFYVLGARNLPSVLLEMGFLSNRKDEALLNRRAHRQVLIQAIRDAIDDYFTTIRASASRT